VKRREWTIHKDCRRQEVSWSEIRKRRKEVYPKDPSFLCATRRCQKRAMRSEQYEWDEERNEESRFLMRLNRECEKRDKE